MSIRNELALATAVLLLIAFILYTPLFWGEIPFPVDLVSSFPPWELGPFPAAHAEYGDLITQMYPWRTFAAESVRDGVFPFRNPYILGGVPFLGNAQSALLYPPHVLYYILPVPVAWGLMFALHAFLGGLFTFLFLREIGCRAPPALLGATTFAMCGFMTVWRGYPMGEAAVWLPLVCMSVVRLRRGLSARSIVLVAVAFAMPIFAGHPETAIHITLVGLCLAALEWARPPEDAAIRDDYLVFPAMFALAGTLSIMVVAIQLLPTLESIEQGTQTLDSRWSGRPLSELLALFSRDLSNNPNGVGVSIPEGAAYVGTLPLLLVSLALFRKQLKYVFFFLLAGGSAFLIAYDVEPFRTVTASIPVLQALKNGRLLLVVDFSLAVLAALGFAVLSENAARLRTDFGIRRSVKLLLAGLTGCSLFVYYGLATQTTNTAIGFQHPVTGALLLAVGFVLVILNLTDRVQAKHFVFVCLLLLTFDLISFSRGYVPFTDADEAFPPAPLFEFLSNNTGTEGSRVAVFNTSYPSNFGTMYGIRSAGGYDNAPSRYRCFIGEYTDSLDSVIFRAERMAAIADRRLDLLSVRYFIISTFTNPADAVLSEYMDGAVPAFVDGSVHVYENTNAMPHAWLVPADGIEIYPDTSSRLLRTREDTFDPWSTVLLPAAPAFMNGPNAGSQGSNAQAISNVQLGINFVQVATRVVSQSILVVSEFYGPGWSVKVNGESAELLEADYALMGVALGPGQHEVEFVYVPAAFPTAMTLSLAGFVCALGLVTYRPKIRAWLQPSAAGGPQYTRAAFSHAMTVFVTVVACSYLASFLDRPEAELDAFEIGMELSATEIVAGSGSYSIFFSGISEEGPITVRYRLDGGPIQEFTVFVGTICPGLIPFDVTERGTYTVTFNVSEETERGTYTFIELQAAGADEWIEVNSAITVR